MTRASVQVRSIRIELDDAGLVVERDGRTYAIAWKSGPVPDGTVPKEQPPQPDEGDQKGDQPAVAAHGLEP